MDSTVNIFWFRRDLRLNDNAGLYYSLKDQKHPTLCVFIFDTSILKKLPADDTRVNFIYQQIVSLKQQLRTLGSDLLVLHDTPGKAWDYIIKSYKINQVFVNRDYEPLAIKRDLFVSEKLKKESIDLHSFKDQTIYDPSEIANEKNLPYTVFSPFANKWKKSLTEFFITPYPNKKYFSNFYKINNLTLPSLIDLGFKELNFKYPNTEVKTEILKSYQAQRDFPAKESTSKIGIHLRFGTVSIREMVILALKESETWLNELIWREFFMHLLFHFPQTVQEDFKPQVLAPVIWENDADKFERWSKGQTGFPLIDAGMRELNQTGFMHNRVRMLVASFLVKNLLIHWKFGERYFAQKLLDYDLSANIGNWQWCAGCGADAAPYFRIFNPNTQIEKFDEHYEYVKKWVPEYGTDSYVQPMVDLKVSRNNFLNFFKPK